jgi:hypothetical protein
MKKKKLKLAFGFFLGLVTASLFIGIRFLESERFAGMVKEFISKKSPDAFGLKGDFSNLKLYFFPPGIGITNPQLNIQKNNVLKKPIESKIEAKEMRVHFEPIQMLSGTIQVSNVVIQQGALDLTVFSDFFKGKTEKKRGNQTRWSELFELQLNGVELQDTYVHVSIETPEDPNQKIQSEFVVKSLSAHKEKKKKNGWLTSAALVKAVKFNIPKKVSDFPIQAADELEWSLILTEEGVRLNPMKIKTSGLEITAEGKVTGDVLDPNDPLVFALNSTVKSDLHDFLSAYEITPDANGTVVGSVFASGKLKEFEKSLKTNFKISGENTSWKDCYAASFEGDGVLDLSEKMVQLKNLVLHEKKEKDQGGQIRFSETKFSLTSPLDQLKSKVEFKNASLHWAAGIILQDIYSLRSNLDGAVDLSFKKGNLEIKPEIMLKGFAFTNQKYKVNRPLFNIIKPREPLKIRGLMTMKKGSGKIDFEKVTVGMRNTNFEANGFIGVKNGFDLHVKGNVDLADVDQIAEIPIRGNGSLATHISGNSDGVVLDFDPILKNAEYVGLKLGELTGRVTYDQLADELRFSGIHAKQGRTFYTIQEGFVDLSNESEIRIPAIINTGRTEDLNKVLEKYTSMISWYPVELKGEVHGSVLIHGKTDFAKMIIESKLEGTDWRYLGERARKVLMNAGYDQGTYFAKDVVLTKSAGSIKGFLEFDSKTRDLNWTFSTDSFSFSDIDFFERLEVPARSKIEIKSVGSGRLNHLVSNTTGRFYQTRVKGEVLEPTTFSFEVSESTLRANVELFGQKLRSSLKYALTPKQPSSFTVDFSNLDFTPLLLILNPKLLDDSKLLGLVDGRIQYDFLSTQSELAKGEIILNKYILRKTGFELSLLEPIQTGIQLGYFQINPTRIRTNQSELILSGEGARGDIDLKLKGEVDLALAEVFSSSIQKVNGKGDVSLRISGPLKDLKMNGDLFFQNTYFLMRWLQTPFEEMDGRIKISQNLIDVSSIEGFLGEELFSLNGKIYTYTSKFPTLDLHARLENNKIKMQPIDLAQVRGQLMIKGDHPPYSISGALDLVQGLWTKSFSQSGGAVGGRTDRFAPVDPDKQKISEIFNLNLSINAPQGFFVRNEIMDGEFRGKIRLVGPAEDPKMLGEGQLVQGKILFRDRPFILESAKIIFDDPYALKPKFNVSAVSEVNNYKVRVLAYGKSDSWKAEFTSTPYLSQNDIFSLLASGSTSSDGSRFRSMDRSYVNQGEAASLVLHSLEFGKDVQSKTGFQFDVEEAVDSQSASSIFSPQNRSSNVAAPKLVLKRQVGRKIGISIGSTVGVGNQVQREVNAEYLLGNSVSVMGVWNNFEEVNTRETRTSFGLDLKLNKRFK